MSMTSTQKRVTMYLLSGCYMVKSVSHAGTDCYRIKTANHCPVMNVHKLDMILKSVLKKDKHGRYTFNKSLVRQLSRRHLIKKLYIKYKNENNHYKRKAA
jgi:hypothetical protein